MASNLYYLSVALGLLFCAVGVTKVVPVEPAYSTQKSEFHRFVSVFPFKSYTGYQPSADLYRTVVGVLEIVFGALLAFGTYQWHRNAGSVLLVVMIGAVYTLLAIGDPPQMALIPAVTGGLLFFIITRGGSNYYIH